MEAANPFSQPAGPLPSTQSMQPKTATQAVTCGQHSASRQSPQGEAPKAFVQATHWFDWQLSPPKQLPQVPPQPFEPHSLPAQLGTQHWPL